MKARTIGYAPAPEATMAEEERYRLTTAMTPAQRELIEQAARLETMPTSTWVRSVIVHAARARIAQERRDVQQGRLV